MNENRGGKEPSVKVRKLRTIKTMSVSPKHMIWLAVVIIGSPIEHTSFSQVILDVLMINISYITNSIIPTPNLPIRRRRP